MSVKLRTDKNKKITVLTYLRVRLLVRSQRLVLPLSLTTAKVSTLLERIRCDSTGGSQRISITNTGTTITGNLTFKVPPHLSVNHDQCG